LATNENEGAREVRSGMPIANFGGSTLSPDHDTQLVNRN
jgi:hypothetical protein